MGKGNRNSQQRINDRLANEEKNLAREKARKSEIMPESVLIRPFFLP